MRWLVIALLVSLCVLLFAATAMARHIWLQRVRPRTTEPVETTAVGEEADLEQRR